MNNSICLALLRTAGTNHSEIRMIKTKFNFVYKESNWKWWKILHRCNLRQYKGRFVFVGGTEVTELIIYTHMNENQLM